MNSSNHATANHTGPKEVEAIACDFHKSLDQLNDTLQELMAQVIQTNRRLQCLRERALDHDLMNLINEAFEPHQDLIEYKISVKVIKEIGSISFIKKMLWSDDAQDWFLATALKEIIPTLELLVNKYPDLLLHQAAVLIAKLKTQELK